MNYFDFTILNYFDYFVIFILIISTILSTMRGMTREILALLGWIIALTISFFSYSHVNTHIVKLIKVNSLSEVISWALPFSISVIIWYFFASSISPSLKRAGLGFFDRWLGMMFGFFRGTLLLIFLHLIIIFSFDKQENIPLVITESKSIPIIKKLSTFIIPLLPDDFSKKIKIKDPGDKEAKEILNNLNKIIHDNNLKKNMELREDEKF